MMTSDAHHGWLRLGPPGALCTAHMRARVHSAWFLFEHADRPATRSRPPFVMFTLGARGACLLCNPAGAHLSLSATLHGTLVPGRRPAPVRAETPAPGYNRKDLVTSVRIRWRVSSLMWVEWQQVGKCDASFNVIYDSLQALSLSLLSTLWV